MNGWYFDKLNIIFYKTDGQGQNVCDFIYANVLWLEKWSYYYYVYS